MRQTITNHCAITVTAFPGSQRADVRVAGVVDEGAAPLLADAVRRLCEWSPRSVFVDLAAVTCAGPELISFLAVTHSRMARSSSLVVSRAAPAIRSALAAAGVLSFVYLCESRRC
ncbi:hypothetical protein [Actinoplanes sp. NPDC049599]|uniref:hypothetical protein n=1 Tax=Actinoplanes sp. NPDC049599 TaxID=3363903 RepID=UPI0037B03767